jgi:RHH-type proline utilization regulon transcriptional repressor/proline dehydrogenase/delta 1-pyrroline-5-carboxylate dehydrogenase
MAWPFLRRKRPAADLAGLRDGEIERQIQVIAADLLDAARAHEQGFFSTRFYSDKLVNWAMKDPHFKTQLFRFVDVYPTLRTPQQVYDHVAEHLLRDDVQRPPGFDLGMKLGSLAKGAVAGTMSSQIRSMARQFIAGATADEAIPQLRDAWDNGVAFSVDLLGEVCLSDVEADVYLQRYLEVLDRLATSTRDWPARETLETDSLGPVPRINISIKLSSLSARLNPLDPTRSIDDLRTRVMPILQRARQVGAFVNVDMEHSALQPLTVQAFKTFASEIDTPIGLAMQAYLASGDDDAGDLVAWAKSIGRVVTVRLVKGAYWDHETILAEMNGWPPAVWPTKRQTDACFERMAGVFLESTPKQRGAGGVMLAVGSHNLRSVAAALAHADRVVGTTRAVEIQMLYGMADPIKLAAAERSLRIRNYVPLGEMIPGMAYLVRRLLENTSNESWLRAGFVENADRASLFASPHDERSTARPGYDRARAADRHALSDAPPALGSERFISEPPRDFSVAAERDRFAAALASLRSWDRSVVNVSVEQAGDAVARAAAAAAAWQDRPAADRARLLLAGAGSMRRQRDRLAGMIVVEAGKPWAEADAEACEAIDFCDYYARQSLALFEPRRLGRFVGELDEVWYQPRGVAVVISPWNFPLAIACGMTVAALVTGNTVLLKPAEQTPAIARELVSVLHDAGFPRDVLQLVPGVGETVGASLVRDPRVALIAFTGSRQVGFDILRAAGDTRDEQGSVKKVIAEMGGKNAMIIDESADPDEAVLGVRQSAFGYAGQKCSAGSRLVIVDGSDDGQLYARFVERLVAATRCLVVGDPRDPGTQVGPVIDREAQQKILRFVEIGRTEATLALAMDVPDGLEARTGRAFVGPHVFTDVPPTARIWREEIFGPVLAVTRARSFDEAIDLANASPYKLTGGVYSRTPSHLEQAKRRFRVGNLYLNRGITGALVGRQPFGGFGHSGVGSKAGGGDYLLQFVEPRACCENTLRRGFAPGMD